MLVPYNDPDLLSDTGTAADSPYVIAITRAGIKVLPHIVNACVFTSAFSAGNSFLFSSSRVIYGLALRGQAPRFLTYCTKQGLPIIAVLVTGAFGFLAFMNTSSGAVTVFNWLVNLTAVGGYFSWAGMNITYVFFYRGMKAQGFDRKKLVYNNSLQPWLSYWGIFWSCLIIIINGYAVFWDFNASGFLTACKLTVIASLQSVLLTRPRQTSTSPSSSASTLAGRSTSAQRYGVRTRWTLSRASRRSRRPRHQRFRQDTSGTRYSISSSRQSCSMSMLFSLLAMLMLLAFLGD